MSKIKNGGLDQYGAEPFEQQQCGTAGVEGVKGLNDVARDVWSVGEQRIGNLPEGVAVYGGADACIENTGQSVDERAGVET